MDPGHDWWDGRACGAKDNSQAEGRPAGEPRA